MLNIDDHAGEIRSLEQGGEDPQRREATLARTAQALDLRDLWELAVRVLARVDPAPLRAFIEQLGDRFVDTLATHVDAALLAQAAGRGQSRLGPNVNDGVDFMNVILGEQEALTPYSTHFPCCPEIAFDVTAIETIASIDLNLYAVDFKDARAHPMRMWDEANLREQLDATPMMVMCPGCSRYVRLLETSPPSPPPRSR